MWKVPCCHIVSRADWNHVTDVGHLDTIIWTPVLVADGVWVMWRTGRTSRFFASLFQAALHSFCCRCSKYPSLWETTASRLLKLITIDLIWCPVIALVQQKALVRRSACLHCFSRCPVDLLSALLTIFWWLFEELSPLTVCMRPLYWTLWSLKLFVNSQNWTELAVAKVLSIVWVVLPRV